ncbi:MAG: hypothetical protein HFH68_00300 [Lachnospiraceae bacterium]|nr:hypothetical protein [Lachnospiraceae bacterium]
MTKNYITDCFTRDNDGTHFKGLIWSSDFDTGYPQRRNIARRIAMDYETDQLCKKNSKARDRKQKQRKGKQK